LDGPPQDLASFFCTDVSPPRRSKAYGGSLDRRWRQLSARNFNKFERQIEQDLWREAGVPHHRAQTGAAA
jgi:hypothetical protein